MARRISVLGKLLGCGHFVGHTVRCFLGMLWSTLCALAYFYMVSSWGGYVFLINLIPLHVFTLMVVGRFSHKVYVAYTTVYALGTILSMQISFVGFAPVETSEHMMVSIQETVF